MHFQVFYQLFHGDNSTIFKIATIALLKKFFEVHIRCSRSDCNIDFTLCHYIIRNLIINTSVITLFLEIFSWGNMMNIAFQQNQISQCNIF